MLQQVEFDLRIVYGWEELKDALDFENAFVDDIAGKGDVTDGGAQEIEAAWGSAWDTAV